MSRTFLCHAQTRCMSLYNFAVALNGRWMLGDDWKKTETEPLTNAIIENTAREEILENGNWFSYMKNNKLSLDF